MSKKVLAGGLAAVVLLGGAWAGTTWYSGQKVEQIYQQSIQKASKDSMGMFSLKLTSYERGFLRSKANWELTLTLDPCNPNDSFVLAGYDNIQQGFIPSLGWASVDSHIIWPDAVQARLKEIFGSKEPLTIESKVDFLGNIHMAVSSPAIAWADQSVKLDWKGLEGDLKYSTKNSLDVNVEAPKLQVFDVGSKTGQFTLEKIYYTSSQADASVPFSETTAKFGLGRLEAVMGPQQWALGDLSFSSEGKTKQDVLQFNADYTIKHIEIAKKPVGDFKAKFSLNNISAAAARQSYEAFSALQKQCNPTPQQMIDAFKPVLMHGFNAKLDNAQLKLFDGKAIANGTLSIANLSDADLQNPDVLRQKVTVDGLLQISDKILTGAFEQVSALKGEPSSPAESAQAVQMLMQGMLQQGIVTKTADGYQSVFKLQAGQPVLNGKLLGQPLPQ